MTTAAASEKSWLFRNLGAVLVGLFVLAIALIVATVTIYAFIFGDRPFSSEQTHWAEFGDFMGGVLNPTLAFIALLALLLTLRVQANELENSSRELRNSARALADQTDTLKTQNFEAKFFQLVKLHNDLLASIDLHGPDGKVIAVGRDCFRKFYRLFKKDMEPALRGDFLEYEEGLRSTFREFYLANEHNLAHYFRTLHVILDYVHESGREDVPMYARIVRAQLSRYELVFIFYYGFSEFGVSLKPLMEQYEVLENLNASDMMNWSIERALYEQSVYGNEGRN